MKPILLLVLLSLTTTLHSVAQNNLPADKNTKEISLLIDQYSQAREKRDTVLLKSILTTDVDQLVSTGEWRSGVASSVKGMLASSATTPGTRTLTIDKLRFLAAGSAIVDCIYSIKNADGTDRKMWSTFVVLQEKGKWKISAIRNMLPSK